MKKLKYFFFGALVLLVKVSTAQNGDVTYHSNIRSAKLYKAGDQTSFPMLWLNKDENLELHFDDLDADVKTYYYTFQLCNADW